MVINFIAPERELVGTLRIISFSIAAANQNASGSIAT
jgi:hypothetical protein